MKTFIKSIGIGIGLFSLIACPKDNGCVSITETLNRSINLIDKKNSSSYYNLAVANFKLTQNIKSYKSADNDSTCNTVGEYSTSLIIQNSTTKKITFDYNISFSLNMGGWNYQGVATIPAGGIMDVGVINGNPLNITLGSIMIQSSNITYE